MPPLCCGGFLSPTTPGWTAFETCGTCFDQHAWQPWRPWDVAPTVVHDMVFFMVFQWVSCKLQKLVVFMLHGFDEEFLFLKDFRAFESRNAWFSAMISLPKAREVRAGGEAYVEFPSGERPSAGASLQPMLPAWQ